MKDITYLLDIVEELHKRKELNEKVGDASWIYLCDTAIKLLEKIRT